MSPKQFLNVILIADAVFADLPGGSRMVAWELGQQLTNAGHQVTFLVSTPRDDFPENEYRDGVRIVRYSRGDGYRRFIRNGRQACDRLLADPGKPFDIAHTQLAWAAIGPALSIGKRLPIVRTFHGPWDQEGFVQDTYNIRSFPALAKAHGKRLLRRFIERRDLHNALQVTVLSDYLAKELVSRFGIAANKVHKVPGGVDSTRFSPSTESKAECRRRLELPAQGRLLLSIRRLAPRMGLDNLLRAMPRVLGEFPNTTLVIGGKGPERERLARIVSELGIESSVRLAGYVPDDLIADYYRSADVFILPTLALEGFGLVTIEALSCGTPVIGTPVGATPEILKGIDPRLVATGSGPDDLAGAIVRFFHDPELTAMDRYALHDMVRQRYSWQKHASLIVDQYRHCLIARGSRPSGRAVSTDLLAPKA